MTSNNAALIFNCLRQISVIAISHQTVHNLYHQMDKDGRGIELTGNYANLKKAVEEHLVNNKKRLSHRSLKE